MIASQFILDHRLAELRQAGADPRPVRIRSAAGHGEGGIVRSVLGLIRSLLGGPTTGNQPVGLAAH